MLAICSFMLQWNELFRPNDLEQTIWFTQLDRMQGMPVHTSRLAEEGDVCHMRRHMRNNGPDACIDLYVDMCTEDHREQRRAMPVAWVMHGCCTDVACALAGGGL